MHSIKSIKNLKQNEKTLEGWFTRLHSFVLDKSNASYNGHNRNTNTVANEKNEKIDLTGTYNTILRGYAKEGQVEAANRVLSQMHELCNYNECSKKDGFNCISTIDVRTNAYNLVLGTCRKQKDVPLAIEILNRMIESMSISDKSVSAIPLPDNQSFASVIGSLTMMADMNASKTIAENFIVAFEKSVKEDKVAPSTNVHNAYINLLSCHFGHRNDLIPMCNAIVNKMTTLAMKIPEMKPDTSTYLALLKACSNGNGDAQAKIERIKIARDIFNEMKDGEKGELTDKSFQFMMKCVSYVTDEEERTEEIINLFDMASKLGFVSAEVLKLLKQNVSAEEFSAIVGRGRLADNWIANVTSAAVKYTDFTNGGANKNARRKGKSTSNWEKKQRERKAGFETRKQKKIERKNERKAHQVLTN